MQTRTLGKDLQVSAVGLGCMGFSHAYGAPTESGEAVRLLRRAFPHKAILADLKMIDSSRAETRCALQAGADWVTVLAVAGDLTIRRTVEAARDYCRAGGHGDFHLLL